MLRRVTVAPACSQQQQQLGKQLNFVDTTCRRRNTIRNFSIVSPGAASDRCTCRLWVKRRHAPATGPLLLYPQERTSSDHCGMSVLCQYATWSAVNRGACSVIDSNS